MNRIVNMMRTTAFRLSALYILLFGLVAIAMFSFMTSRSLSLLREQTQSSLQEELIYLGNAYQKGGIPLLMRSIDKRSHQPGAFLYLVADPVGRILAGNVASIETGTLNGEGLIANSFIYSRFGEGDVKPPHRAIAMVFELPNGMKLLVGRDLGELGRFIEVIRQAILIAATIMLIGALLIWFLIGRRALHRIDNVTAASQRIMDGDLTGRLPVSGSGDEFDRLSKNLNIMLERIEELNEGLRQVSNNIAHDLKTPLTRLRNRAEDALSKKHKDNTSEEDNIYRQSLEAIIIESDQLIRTFNAILMIARIEASTTIEHLEKINIRPIVEDAGELYEPVAEEAGGALTVSDCFDAKLLLNRELVAQAIINLIDNAVKYAGSDGKKPEIKLFMQKDDTYIKIIIADNGLGIPQEYHEKVTERFVRLEKSRTKQGVGIGLSLAKAVMKLHGGQLILENGKEGQWSGLFAILVFPKLKEE